LTAPLVLAFYAAYGESAHKIALYEEVHNGDRQGYDDGHGGKMRPRVVFEYWPTMLYSAIIKVKSFGSVRNCQDVAAPCG